MSVRCAYSERRINETVGRLRLGDMVKRLDIRGVELDDSHVLLYTR